MCVHRCQVSATSAVSMRRNELPKSSGLVPIADRAGQSVDSAAGDGPHDEQQRAHLLRAHKLE